MRGREERVHLPDEGGDVRRLEEARVIPRGLEDVDALIAGGAATQA